MVSPLPKTYGIDIFCYHFTAHIVLMTHIVIIVTYANNKKMYLKQTAHGHNEM